MVVRHRKPVIQPYPNESSHPLPRFTFEPSTGMIRICFSCDPSYPPHSTSPSNLWRERDYVLGALSKPRPKSLVDSAADFFSSAAALVSFNPFGAPSSESSTAHVADGQYDLRDEEILEEERIADEQDDSSPEPRREVRMLTFPMGWMDKDERKDPRGCERRKWEIVSLQSSRSVTRIRSGSGGSH